MIIQKRTKKTNYDDIEISLNNHENKIDNKRVLLGSKNKNLSFITNRYKKYEEYFNNPISIEEVTAEDIIFINGD